MNFSKGIITIYVASLLIVPARADLSISMKIVSATFHDSKTRFYDPYVDVVGQPGERIVLICREKGVMALALKADHRQITFDTPVLPIDFELCVKFLNVLPQLAGRTLVIEPGRSISVVPLFRL